MGKVRKFRANTTIFDEYGNYIQWRKEFREKETFLKSIYEEEEPISFVKEVIPAEYLDTYMSMTEVGQRSVLGLSTHTGKGCGLVKRAVGLYKNGKPQIKSFLLHDDYKEIDWCIDNRFSMISMCTYFGKGKERIPSLCFGLAIDLDYVRLKELEKLLYFIDEKIIPVPTYIANSGKGVHLYYLFEKPISLKDTVVQGYLTSLKNKLIEIIWTESTSLDKDRQFQSIYQDIRMAGSWTKFGNNNKTRCSYIVRAFKTGERVDLTYLTSFCGKLGSFEDYASLSATTRMPLSEAKEKYPDWYRRIVLEKQEKGFYIQSRGLYEWWKSIITKPTPTNGDEQMRTSHEGNRFYCISVLFVMAYKCGISLEEATQDALNLISFMNEREHHEDNEFTVADVMSASAFYDRKYVKWGNKGIAKHCSIVLPEPKTRRNGRIQEEHLKRTRHLRVLSSYENVGRPKGSTYETVIKKWRERNPNGKKVDCIKETGLSKPTVYKWWIA